MKIIYDNVHTKIIPSRKELKRIEKIRKKLTYRTFQYDLFLKKKVSVEKTLLKKRKNYYYFLSGLWPLAFEEDYPPIHKNLILPEKEWPKGVIEILRDYQIESIKSLLKQPRGILDASTGSGKSYIMVLICKLFKPDVPILVIVPKSQSLLEQTLERFFKNYHKSEIGFNYGKGYKEGRIMISSPGCLQKLNLNYYKIILLDECQTAPARSISNTLIQCRNAVIRYGFSGTPFGRSDQKDLITIGLLGKVVKQIKYKDLQPKGYLAKLKYIFINFHSEFLLDPEISYYSYSFDWNEVATNFFLTKTRNYVIKLLSNFAIKFGRKPLIIVERKVHGKILEDSLSSLNAKFISSDTPNVSKEIKKFKEGKYNLLIATSLIETGIDIPNLDTIILGGIGKSYIQLLQRIGRGLRPKENRELLVFDLVDHSSVVLKNHATKRKQYVKNENFPSEEVNVVDLKNFKEHCKKFF